ncbi:hypothetical protein ALNOE001_10490 [Candidatus Methanobinarius endosymbioticus]|uniref:Right handed beta helix domain-containing protein n=1 Tax=Candidatus Methanobinarius endosymbioticus TaxID=2006182 RepID=A0A366MB57_9EURY|nr:hypothetical protein ALNOE001_10490 [Candidatus Methanobinarius endosymbioticus]
MILTNYVFINNRVDLNGDAIDNYGNSVTTLIDCTFINNTAGSRDGAIYNSQNSQISIVSCIFINNRATSTGSAIVNGGFDNFRLNVSFSVFYNNTGETIIKTDGRINLKDNFYFWVNPDISNSTYMNQLMNSFVNLNWPDDTQNFYYLKISNNTVINAGQILNIKSLL